MALSLSSISIYPVKSLRGLACETAKVEPRGLRHDRRWMIVDEHGVFLTQRECPTMACVAVTVEDDRLRLSAPGQEPLSVAASTEGMAPITVRVWRSVCVAQAVSADADRWLTEFLERPCRLVFMPDTPERFVNPDYAVHPGGDVVSFADGYPLLLIGEGSHTELNARLETPLPMDRFRPNLVISGTPPFAEDDWKQVQIGACVFHVVKPCDRCAVTTIDQATGAQGREPLATLAAFRRRDGKVLFGQYLIPESSGQVRVGDAVSVLEKSPGVP